MIKRLIAAALQRKEKETSARERLLPIANTQPSKTREDIMQEEKTCLVDAEEKRDVFLINKFGGKVSTDGQCLFMKIGNGCKMVCTFQRYLKRGLPLLEEILPIHEYFPTIYETDDTEIHIVASYHDPQHNAAKESAHVEPLTLEDLKDINTYG
jgi:hypothetical protein